MIHLALSIAAAVFLAFVAIVLLAAAGAGVLSVVRAIARDRAESRAVNAAHPAIAVAHAASLRRELWLGVALCLVTLVVVALT